MSSKYNANSAFTLFELMITVAVLITAIVGLLAAYLNFFTLNENARKLTLAITACQNKMEEMRKAGFSTLYSTYNGTQFNPGGFPATEARGNVYIKNTNPDLLEVHVSVSWMERSNRIIGEDLNLNGALDTGEDLNGDNRLSSPAEISTFICER